MATTQDACSTLRCLRMGSITFDPRRSEVVDLNLLERGMPGITPRWGASLAEAATVCLEEQKHPTGVFMMLDGDCKHRLRLVWRIRGDREQRARCYGDPTGC